MGRVAPWSERVALIEPYYWGKALAGRPPFPCELMLRVHFLQQWFDLIDPAMEEALHDGPLYRVFIGIDVGAQRLPDDTTILRFRHLLEAFDLAPAMQTLINELLQTRGLMLKAGTSPCAPASAGCLPDTPGGRMLKELEHAKASIRVKVEHPFWVIKRQFGYTKVRYWRLAKNTAQFHTLFALSNLWMAR